MSVDDGTSNTSYLVRLNEDNVDFWIESTLNGSCTSKWKSDGIDPPQYFEYKVYAQKTWIDSNQDGSSSKESFSTYKCAACNLKVPRMFMKQHKNSLKHKNCLKLIDMVLERVKDVVGSTDNDLSNVRQMKNVYFCEPCASTVKVEDKVEHNLSREHFKSMLHEKFLNDLLMIFNDKDYLDSVNFDYFNEGFERDKQNENFNLSTDFYHSISDTSTISEEEEDEIVCNKIEKERLTLKEYIDVLNQKVSGTPLALDGDCIKVTTLDKAVLKIPEENFHGFYKLHDLNVCGPCQCLINDTDGGIEGHKMSSKHMENVLAPLPDVHCIREGSMFVYCALCNTVIGDKEIHKGASLHTTSLNKAFIYDATIDATIDAFNRKPISQSLGAIKKVVGNRTYCKPCKLYIDTHNFTNHCAGKIHTNNTKPVKDSMKIPIELIGGITKPIIVEEENVNTEKEISSDISKQDYFSAFNIDTSSESMSTCTEVSNTNKVTSNIGNNAVNTIIPQLSNGESNQRKAVTDVISKAEPNTNLVADVAIKHDHIKLLDGTNNVLCIICNKMIINTAYHITEHVHGKPHNKNLLSSKNKSDDDRKIQSKTDFSLNNMNRNLSAAGPSKQNASIVNKSEYRAVSATEMNEAHMMIDRILENVKVKMTNKVTKDEPVSSAKNTIKARDVAITHDHIEPTDIINTVFCVVCNVKIPNKVDNITTHVKGKQHNKNFDEIVKSLHIFLKAKGHRIHCVVCKTDVKISERLTHVNSTKHVESLDKLLNDNNVYKINSVYFCVKCLQELECVSILPHLKSQRHRKMGDVSISNVHFCDVCRVNVPVGPKNVAVHYVGRAHKKSNVQKAENKKKELCIAKLSDVESFCWVCQLRLLNADINAHLESRDHLSQNNSITQLINKITGLYPK